MLRTSLRTHITSNALFTSSSFLSSNAQDFIEERSGSEPLGPERMIPEQ